LPVPTMATVEDPKSAKREEQFKHRRRAPEKDDFELNAQGEALLASIDVGYRPEALVELFPRIVNRMAKLWKQPGQMERYFEDLLIDHRGNRSGFPLKVLMDLSTLKDYYQRSAFAPTLPGTNGPQSRGSQSSRGLTICHHQR
jgi:hypothetical protein